MEIPDLVRDRLGEEEIRAGVNLGDEDALCLTETRTIIYSGEGLLSDESVSVYGHDIEQLTVSDGRRKTKFTLEYVDGTKSFTVPADRGEKVIQLLMEGVLQVAGVTDPDESVRGVYRFSELTLVVAEGRLVKHVGTPVWDEDFEEFPYDAVTGLDFEEGSVATQIVLTVGGRPQRIKAPNEKAPVVQETLTKALCAYHGVNSIEELNTALAESEETASESRSEPSSDPTDLTLDTGIDPLVGGDEDGEEDHGEDAGVAASADDSTGGGDAATAQSSPEAEPAADATPDTDEADTESTDAPGSETPWPGEADDGSEGDPQSGVESSPAPPATESESVSDDELEAVSERLSELTTAVQKQNDLLRKQHDAFQQLVEELRKER